MNEDPDAPVTDIIFVKGLEECPEGYKMISNTPCQHKAQLWENLRGEEDEERYIAFIKDPNDKQVVEDFMITDGGGRYLRPGFVVMRRTLVGDKVFRHRDVAVKKGPRKAAVRAVLDVAVFKSNDKPSKLYRKIIKIHGLYVCVRVGPLQPKYKSGIVVPPPPPAATDQHHSSSGAVGRTARNLTPEPARSPGSERTLLEGAMGDMRIRSNTAPTSAPYPSNGPYNTPAQVGGYAPYPTQSPQGTHSVAGSTANASTSVYGQHSDRPPPATALYPTSAPSNGTSSTTAASLVPPFPSTDTSHKASPSSNPSQPDHSSSQHYHQQHYHQQQRWPSAAAVIRQPPPINPAYPGGGGGGGQYSSPQYPATQPPQHYSQPIGFGSMPGYPPPPQHMHQNYAQAGSVYPPPANHQGFPQPLGTTGPAPYPVPQGGQVPPNQPPSYQSQAPTAPHSNTYGFNL